MKKLLSGIMLAAVAAIVSTACSTQSNVTAGHDTGVNVRQMLADGEFNISIDRMDPMSGPSRTLTTPYNIQVSGGKVQSYLPYFGRAYTLPYGGGEGLSFTTDITDYTVKQGRRKSQVATFSARTVEDSYDFTIQIFDNGKAYVTITPNNKQSISFDGEMMPVKQE